MVRVLLCFCEMDPRSRQRQRIRWPKNHETRAQDQHRNRMCRLSTALYGGSAAERLPSFIVTTHTATRPEAQYPDDYANHLAAPSAAKGSRSWHFWPSSSEALKLISSCCRLLLLPKTTGQLRSALNETSSG